MARQPKVTRTIKSIVARILVLNVETGETTEEQVVIAGTFKDEAKLMAKVKAVVDTDVLRAVHLYSTEVRETLYGMSEQTFIENAEILEKR